MNRMRFGIFLAPFHKPGINPTLALEQDLELLQWLDRCGFDEAWCGEHHSAGYRDQRESRDPDCGRLAAHAAYPPGHRRRQRQLSQPVVGGRAHRAARSPYSRAGDAGPRARLAAERRRDDRHLAVPDAATARRRPGHHHEAAHERRAASRSRTIAGNSTKRGCICARIRIRCSTSPCRPLRRRPGRSSPACTASGCCRSVRPRPPVLMRSPCTGT